MGTGRNRASGWKHAKLSGHENESDVESLFKDDEFKSKFSQRLGIGKIISAHVGGLCETDVESILGGKTKSKTDLTLKLVDGQNINISIKKVGEDKFILSE